MRYSFLIASILVLLAGCASSAFDRNEITNPGSVTVTHSPILPITEPEITFTAQLDVPAGYEIASSSITVLSKAGNRTFNCMAQNPCRHTMPRPAEPGTAIYSAKAVFRRIDAPMSELQRSTPGGYQFTYGMPGAEGPVPIRVPFNFSKGATARRIDTLFIRDKETLFFPGSNNYLMPGFRQAVEGLIYEGILNDPVMRLRDDQFGFYMARIAGRTADYYSGLEMRCGHNPYRGIAGGEEARRDEDGMEVTAVIHNREDYRDCAGSSSGEGPARLHVYKDSAKVFVHEFGHAAFGLGDEYDEDLASRMAPAGMPLDPFSICRPCSNGGSGTGPGGPVIDDNCIPLGEDFPASCYPAENALCPGNAGSCRYAPGQRENVFVSRAACEATLADISAIPALANRADELDLANCRLLCAAGECPCVGDNVTYWIADRRAPSVPGQAADRNDDVMSFIDDDLPDEQFGATCTACVETSLCMLWEKSRGRSDAQAQGHCGL